MLMFKTPLVNISKRDSIGDLIVYRLILSFLYVIRFLFLVFFYIFSDHLLRFCLLLLVANRPLFDLKSENVFPGPYELSLNVVSLLCFTEFTFL